jgi:hypothetical protein
VKQPGLLVGGLTAVALGLRLWHLDFQSMWWDEGVSVYLAHQGFAALTIAKDFSVDLHPPGYHLLLAVWSRLVGSSVFSGRLLSAFCGALTVPLTYRFARQLSPVGDGAGRAALLAAGLAAVSPLDLYYSQEIRMYALMPVLALLSLLATARVYRDESPRRWLIWALANAIGLYTYYYLALLALAESAALILGTRKRRRWLHANGGLALSYLPWAVLVARRIGLSGLALPPETQVHLSPAQYLGETAAAFTLGFTFPPEALGIAAIWGALALLGAFTLRRRPEALALLLLAVAIPVAGAGAVLLFRPFYYPRFIIFAAVPVWILAALGASRPGWRIFPILVVPMVLGGLWTWRVERTTPRTGYAPDDYRVVFSTLGDQLQPGDLVLGGYPWQIGYVDAYLAASRPAAEFVPTSASAGAFLDGKPSRVWVYSYSPDHSFAGDRLATAAAAGRPIAFVDQFGDSRVQLFAGSVPPPAAAPMQATFGSDIGLVSASLGVVQAQPGSTVPVTLRWLARGNPGASYTVFVHLLGPDGKVWGQRDSPPLAGGFPTSHWTPGEQLIDRYEIALDPRAPAGRYQVEVGMYRPDTGQRLAVGPTPDPNNRIIVGSLEVPPPPAVALAPR